jgi:hypothetical protein
LRENRSSVGRKIALQHFQTLKALSVCPDEMMG